MNPEEAVPDFEGSGPPPEPEFEELVRQAVRNLPRMFRREMENISIEIEDYPSLEITRKMNVGRRDLLGLYQGVPRNKRSVWQNRSGPDRITLYRANIEEQARTPEQVRRLVRKVVMHEIGHYFGLSDEELRKLRY